VTPICRGGPGSTRSDDDHSLSQDLQQRAEHTGTIGMLLTVGLRSLFAPPGQLQDCQDSGVFPDPPEANLLGQPPVDRQAPRLLHRHRTARAGQRRHQQRRRRRGMHTGAEEGRQGSSAALLCRPINLHLTHHGNGLIFNVNQEAIWPSTSRITGPSRPAKSTPGRAGFNVVRPRAARCGRSTLTPPAAPAPTCTSPGKPGQKPLCNPPGPRNQGLYPPPSRRRMSRALASWRLSPGVSPVSCSRRSSSTTACLTRSRSPLASLSTFSLYLRDQLAAFSCRRTWPTSWQQRILTARVRAGSSPRPAPWIRQKGRRYGPGHAAT